MIKSSIIIYFTTTGNTQMLAESLQEGFLESNIQSVLKNVDKATIDEIKEYDLIALGCSASGHEGLDDTEFDPYFESILPYLKNKKIFLFGSYGWGNGEFMKNWEKRVLDGEGILVQDGFIQFETPKVEDLKKIREIAHQLVQQ